MLAARMRRAIAAVWLAAGLLFVPLNACAQELSLPGPQTVEGTPIEAPPVVESIPPAPSRDSSMAPVETPSEFGPEFSQGNVGYSPIAPGGSYRGGGSTYLPSVGAHLRARFNSESYGQQRGNVDLGMMKLYPQGDHAWMLDGQITLNEWSGLGYNLGAGLRWITDPLLPNSPDREKVMGVSFWLDGQETRNDHFYSQLGVTLEYLGDRFDVRANGYAPVGQRTLDSPLAATGVFAYSENFVVQRLAGARDTALTVGEIEGAARVADLDLWGFSGIYGLAGDGFDTTGYRLGVRGYVAPDLLLQLAVTEDDLFATNTVFSATWFIGRTRTDYCPRGTVVDRMREPVLRNDYIAIRETPLVGADPLLDAATGQNLRVVHADSSAAPGGDGTFENPLQSLDDVAANSQAGDIILLHGGSTFDNPALVMQENQRLAGEGAFDGVSQALLIETVELDTISLPETAAGARELDRPVLDAAVASAVTLAGGATVENLTFTGNDRAINGAAGVSNPTLNNLAISGSTTYGIRLEADERADAGDSDGDGATTEIDFNVAVSDITFENNAADLIIDAAIAADPLAADVDLNETITIDRIVSTNPTGASIRVSNTNEGGTLAINDIEYDGDIGGGTGIVLENTDGASTIGGASTFSGGGQAMRFDGGAGTVNVAQSVAVNEVTGTAVTVANRTGATTFDGDITNSEGRSVVIESNAADVTFGNGTVINDTGDGIAVTDNTAGDIIFFGTTNLATEDNDAFTMTGNADAVTVSLLQTAITTTSGRGLVATGEGSLGVLTANFFPSTISTDSGRAIDLQGIAIDPGGISLTSVDTGVDGNAPNNAIVLQDVTGTGAVRIGAAGGATGSGGTLRSTGVAVQVDNAPDVQLNNVNIESDAGLAVSATYTNDGDDRSMALTGVQTNDDVLVLASGAGTGEVSFSANGGELGAVDVLATHTGPGADLNLSINDVTINGEDISLSTTNSGNVDVATNNNTLVGGRADLSFNNSGEVEFSSDGNSISNTSDEDAVSVSIGQNVTMFDGRMRDNTLRAGDAAALRVATNNSTASSVRFELSSVDPSNTTDRNFLENDSTTPTAIFSAEGNVTMDLGIIGPNRLESPNLGADLLSITSDGAAATLNLQMEGLETAAGTNVNGGDLLLNELNGADFNIVNRDTTVGNMLNDGTIVLTPNDINAFDPITTIDAPTIDTP